METPSGCCFLASLPRAWPIFWVIKPPQWQSLRSKQQLGFFQSQIFEGSQFTPSLILEGVVWAWSQPIDEVCAYYYLSRFGFFLESWIPTITSVEIFSPLKNKKNMEKEWSQTSSESFSLVAWFRIWLAHKPCKRNGKFKCGFESSPKASTQHNQNNQTKGRRGEQG